MQKSFNIKDRQLNCEIVRSRRKTVAIQIYPDKRIELKVPLFYNTDNVEPFLQKHYRWIFKRLDAPIISKSETKRFVSGELHYFLGKQYPLKIVISPDNNVTFQDDVITGRPHLHIPGQGTGILSLVAQQTVENNPQFKPPVGIKRKCAAVVHQMGDRGENLEQVVRHGMFPA